VPQEMELSTALEKWLKSRPDLDVTEVTFSRASNGFSAETIFAEILGHGGQRTDLVFRIEQPGGQIFLDTDIADQARVLKSLADNGIPVPEVLALEEDCSVVGRRFLVMSRVKGKNFPQSPNYLANGWVKELDASQRTQLWANALTLLGRINRLTAADGFEFLDRPKYGKAGLGQYLEWLAAWRDEAVGDQPGEVINAALDWLLANRPGEVPVQFIWGDSNPCNILFDTDLSVSAALDFEAAALAPGEVDLGWWFFMERRRSHGRAQLSGVPDRAESIAIYEAALGRPAIAVDYFEVLGGLRMALVIARTNRRLVETGKLSQLGAVAQHNPIVVTLAELIGKDPPAVGEDFSNFVSAVAGR